MVRITTDKNVIKKVLAYLAAFGAVALLYRIIGCPFRFFIGLPSPGCGMTRAWLAFFHGRFAEAFGWHPLFLAVPPFVLAMMLKNGRVFKNKAVNTVFICAFTLLVMAVYVTRMVYMFPNTEPMVYNSGAVLNRLLNIFKEAF